MRSALPLAAITIAAALLLSGCVPQDPEVIPPPEPSTEPIFASDEEALAAATEAYKAYLAISDLIAQEGGVNPERIAPYVTEDALSDQVDQFSPYSERSLRTVGASTFDEVALQQLAEMAPGVAEITIYVCLDVSAVKVLDGTGIDVTPVDRTDRLPLEIGFEGQGKALLMNRSEIWHDSNYC